MEIKTEKEEFSLDYSIVKEEYSIQYENEKLPENPETVQFLITEVNDRKYKCHLCEKAFTQSYNLKNHMAVHTTEKNFHCPHCSKCFANKVRLGAHVKSHSNEELTCNECGGTYKGPDNLRSHIARKHRPTKRLECEICRKTFADRLSVKRHIQGVHLKIKTEKQLEIAKKTFPCAECGKVLSNKLSFRRHTSTHSDVKNVECPICSKKFRLKYLLYQHMVVHSEQKSFVCEICNQAFKRRISLKVHQSKHTDEPVDCPLCNSTLKNAERLRVHIKRQHKNLPKDTKILSRVKHRPEEQTTSLSTKNGINIKIEEDSNKIIGI